ncbi:hypothetical protein LG047_07110 [Methylocystis sp. WRRC1]|uniref:phage head-tail joining protein n=1 Tax=Methylocystis sp. WRRC1 TaxID=1732014 RepID=UPI001D149415|nr:hypothetical protein [Methylocystis sp. WRRC1]MCC3245087.1 hypothetical protein [Methylocystis sp. WRRC1]
MDLATLQARLNDLLALRYGGEAEIETRTLDASERVRFRSDTELARAIADVERRIAELNGGGSRIIKLSPSKGL